MPNLILAAAPDERILWQHRPAWREFICSLVFGVLLLPVFGLGVIVLLYVIVARFRYVYLVTEERVACEVGILSRDISEIDILDLRDISLHQSLLQRILRTGDVGFSSAGQAGVEVMFRGVSHPELVKKIVRRQKKEINQEKTTQPTLVEPASIEQSGPESPTLSNHQGFLRR